MRTANVTLGDFSHRTWMAVAHDLGAVVLAWWGAYLLRFNLDIPEVYVAQLWRALLWLAPLQILVFWRLGLYRSFWRHSSLPDLKRILNAVGLAAVFLPLALYMFPPTVMVPRTVLLLDPLLLLVMMCGIRIGYRTLNERKTHGFASPVAEPVLVIGAGDAAASLLREIAQSHVWRVVGLLDDDVKKHGRELHGVKVLGSIEEIKRKAVELQVSQVIIAVPGASPSVRRRAAELATRAGLTVLTVPSYSDLLTGRFTLSEIRKVEAEDLLGREQVLLDSQGLYALISGKSVMVTGAGGSIGAELCRQIACFEPRLLLFYEQNEFALYTLEQEFVHLRPQTAIACVIGDTKNRERLAKVFAEYRPTVVFHAAAYKHVPLMEERNLWEAVQNNVLGTILTARAALEHGVDKFVLISTDKAVNPTNVMGATKRLAELACQSLQRTDGTRFVTVRFGNVLGSTGSVIPKFREQIARGGPVTVTHPDITRYFMSIPEAAQMVLQAGLMGRGGEIVVLDMGEPVRIVDLARSMIRLSGFSEEEIQISFVGLRPGEKLYEELLADDEQTLPTPHPKLRIATSRPPAGDAWLQELCAWLQKADPGDERTRQELAERVPEYTLQGAQDRCRVIARERK